jgi:hypothetical protein
MTLRLSQIKGLIYLYADSGKWVTLRSCCRQSFKLANSYFSNICQSLLMGCRNLFLNLLKMDSEIFAFKMMDGN